MKRIDVENAITKYLSDNNLYVRDSLSKEYIIRTYDEYINYFSLIVTTFKNNIVEFSEEGKKYIDKINTLISKTLEADLEDNLAQYIKDIMPRELNYNSYNRIIELISIHPNSFSMQRERSQEAFVNVYIELGYDRLRDYIHLIKNPSNFYSYITDNTKQIVAMKFLLFKTDHHSPKPFTRNLSAENIFKMNNKHIQESLSEITKEKEDYINYMNEQKEDYNKWFSDTTNQINDFREEHSNILSNIEKAYEEKLKIVEPAKFMLEQAEKYKNSFYLWSIAIVILSIILLIFLALIVSPEVKINDKLITINVLSKEMSVYSSIILLAMISLVVYLLRIFIKMAISARHLMEEYKQKHSLTYFYLSLVKNGNINDEKSQNIILSSLFTKADTGLIKNDGSNENDKNILLQLLK